MTPATALTLVDAVQYQPGAVVSRVLHKTPGGTVTAFAFDEGEGLSEHTAPFDALVQILEGSATITIGGAAARAQAGQILTLPANVPHAVHANERFKMLLIMIRATGDVAR
jgi:quercetin dioxygenase-like cupin family protein